MYTYEDLAKYDHFKDVNIDYALDSLTGVLARSYILSFAKELIKDKVPFTMCIMDIDNFKQINDNYGHMVGDIVLKEMGNNLVNYVGENGFVGRFGGDEFIILSLKTYDYDTAHSYLVDLFTKGGIVRHTYKTENVSVYVTGTVGAASFPKDAKDYDELFTKVDKALYRGKTKGRNCFIVYVEELHGKIDVHRREQTSLPILFENVSALFSTNKNPDRVAKDVVDYINDILQLGSVFVVNKDDNRVISSDKKVPYYYDKPYIDQLGITLGNKKIFSSCDLFDLKASSDYANEYLTEKNVQSIIIAKLSYGEKVFGYLCLYENKIVRIWQENDIALVMYVARLLEMMFLNSKNKA